MTFTTLHIALTAAIVAVLALAVGMWRLPRPAWRQAAIVALLSGAAVFLWRLSANKPQLNDDGLPGFSANDWAAPILTYLTLSAYADLRPPPDRARYRQVRALAFVVALAVNVITI
jgi:uncharacterized membrane protein YiaA